MTSHHHRLEQLPQGFCFFGADPFCPQGTIGRPIPNLFFVGAAAAEEEAPPPPAPPSPAPPPPEGNPKFFINSNDEFAADVNLSNETGGAANIEGSAEEVVLAFMGGRVYRSVVARRRGRCLGGSFIGGGSTSLRLGLEEVWKGREGGGAGLGFGLDVVRREGGFDPPALLLADEEEEEGAEGTWREEARENPPSWAGGGERDW